MSRSGIRRSAKNIFRSDALRQRESGTMAGAAWSGRTVARRTGQDGSGFQAGARKRWSRRSPENKLASLRLPLTQFETEVIEFESRDAAKEALFCVRRRRHVDGRSCRRRTLSFPADRFFCWKILDANCSKISERCGGQLLDPIQRGDGFELCHDHYKRSNRKPMIQEFKRGSIEHLLSGILPN